MGRACLGAVAAKLTESSLRHGLKVLAQWLCCVLCRSLHISVPKRGVVQGIQIGVQASGLQNAGRSVPSGYLSCVLLDVVAWTPYAPLQASQQQRHRL